MGPRTNGSYKVAQSKKYTKVNPNERRSKARVLSAWGEDGRRHTVNTLLNHQACMKRLQENGFVNAKPKYCHEHDRCRSEIG